MTVRGGIVKLISNMPETEVAPNSIVVKGINEERRGVSITGEYITVGSLISKSSHQGDKYWIREGNERNILIMVIDISLGGGEERSDDKVEVISESRVLDDLGNFVDNHRMEPILEIRRDFYPFYLKQWEGTMDWGLSVSIVLLDRQRKNIEVTSMGTNFVGIQLPKSEHEFTAAFGLDQRFFSPAIDNDVGGPVEIKTKKIPWGTPLLIATDGIIYKKPFFGPAKIDLSHTPESLLGTNKEGLFLVIKTPNEATS